jgi:aspartate/methionine/tyrosine aminotransferase
LPALREAVSAYHRRIYGCVVDPARVTVTGSGMQALALTAQALLSPGDDAVVVTPTWPNMPGAAKLAGARIVTAAIIERNGRWAFDSDRLFAAVGPTTRAVILSTPNNPTGWVMGDAEQSRFLAFCRERGIWIVCDDVYSRLYYSAPHAPLLLAKAEPDDLVISVNSFSKAWNMTGWRLGWIIAPRSLTSMLGALTEYNISCMPGFVQEAGIIALEEGESYIAGLMAKLAANRDLVAARLSAIPGVRFGRPEGTFYTFFSVNGLNDSVATAKRLVREARVGVAPGRAFGKEGEGYLRLCFARERDDLEEALDRIAAFLASYDR